MIDSVKLILPGNYITHLALRLGDPVGKKSWYGCEYLTWEMENLTLTTNKEKLIVVGSLCKYALGNNLKTLTVGQVDLALCQLEYELELPIKEALVARFDAGVNIETEGPVSSYFVIMGQVSRYMRRTHGYDTLAYDQKQRTMQFYDKRKEMNRKKRARQILASNNRVMRFEVQWKKKVARQWKEKVYAFMLADVDFLGRVATKMKSEYERIPKIDRALHSKAKNWSELRRQLISDGIEKRGGASVITRSLDASCAEGEITSSQKHRMIKRITEHATNPQMIVSSSLADELDLKIENALTPFRMK